MRLLIKKQIVEYFNLYNIIKKKSSVKSKIVIQYNMR